MIFLAYIKIGNTNGNKNLAKINSAENDIKRHRDGYSWENYRIGSRGSKHLQQFLYDLILILSFA